MRDHMNVGLIGYKNHSLRILKLLLSIPDVNRIVIFHPDRSKLITSRVSELSLKIEIANDIKQLHGLDCVFITSPNDSHAQYITALIDQIAYLFCEKPPATTREEIDCLKSLKQEQKQRLYFNFNYRHSALAINARNYLQSGELGELIHMNFVATQGIAFEDSFRGNWRFSGKDPFCQIYGNLGIHYVDLAMWLLGGSPKMEVKMTTWSPHSAAADSAQIQLIFKDRRAANIFCSYAAPMLNTAQIIFTDGFLELRDGVLNVHRPRRTLDESGMFQTPPGESIARFASSRHYYDNSLANSLQYFLKTVSKRDLFHFSDFENSIKVNEIILSNAAPV